MDRRKEWRLTHRSLKETCYASRHCLISNDSKEEIFFLNIFTTKHLFIYSFIYIGGARDETKVWRRKGQVWARKFEKHLDHCNADKGIILK